MTICPGSKTLVRVTSGAAGSKVFWYNAGEAIVAVVADLLNRGF
jgi:hypothetical protein